MINPFLLIALFFMVAHCTAQRKQPVPTRTNNIYSIIIGDQELQADPGTGGRIVAIMLNGHNFLTGKEINEKYWGSTLWPSPQKVWGIDLPELDNMDYAVSVEKNILKMVSRKDPRIGLVFTKEISGNIRDSSFTIRYSITNKSDTIKKIAPWEVTRVHPNGLAFYPRGKGERWGNMGVLAEDINGITWFDHEPGKITPAQNKFYADGSEGWIAQVNEDIIFVKKFPDLPLEKAAPFEAEVEIYTNLSKSYVEIEQQGAYQELRPSASLSWQVSWYIRKLPPGIKRTTGNDGLVNYVRNLVNGHKKSIR